MKTLLIIGGTDSSGGAGLTRDTAVAQDLGLHVMPVVTAVTAQTDQALQKLHLVPSDIVAAQITCAFDSTPPQAIKIGMLGSAEIAGTVAKTLKRRNIPIVLDPVLKSSSGGTLFYGDDLRALMSVSTLLTPNMDEAATLTSRPKANHLDEIKLQSERLIELGAQAVLIKGGHGGGNECVDHLFYKGMHTSFSTPRLTRNKRGTGCTLATAIACYLAAGESLDNACRLGKKYIQCWLAITPNP